VKSVSTATVTFCQLVQDTQNYGSFDPNDNFMVSRLSFVLLVNGVLQGTKYVEVRQACGADYMTEPLEVGAPVGYDGNWNHHEFSDRCEEYYRGCLGMLTNLGPHMRNVRMRNNTINAQMTAVFMIP
jgi:hypothetical protein